jgi:plasmid stabilization system protein ParE
MKKYKVVITEPAEHDLIDIAGYIALELKEPQTTKKLIARIKKAILASDEFPHRQATIDPEIIGIPEIFYFTVESYIVFYHAWEKDKSVHILRILYGKRDWQHLLRGKFKPDNQ